MDGPGFVHRILVGVDEIDRRILVDEFCGFEECVRSDGVIVVEKSDIHTGRQLERSI